MLELKNNQLIGDKSDKGLSLVPILVLWLTAAVSLIVFFIATSDELNPVKQYFLIPWIVLTAVVIAAPLVYFKYIGQLKLYNPIVFAACTYFIPSYILGGFILASGWSEPYFLSLIQDPSRDLPFTMIILMLGFGGLSVGFILPVGSFIGGKLDRILPVWHWESEALFKPCYILLFCGLVNTLIGYSSGVLGYQKVEGGAFDGFLFMLTSIWLEATFLFWLLIFRRNKMDFKAVSGSVVVVIASVIKALYAGNRGGLIAVFILIMLAFVLAGRRLTVQQGVIAGALMVFCLFFGMIYGTTFRNLKETESRIGLEEYTENIFTTFDAVSERDNLATLEQGFYGLAERLDAVSSLAVVVSNYEQLAPYEESYGLDDNIYKDTVTFFIPRFIWNDKPLASEPRKYSELYFNYGENSFPITPMGDLLRNYGVAGVFIGMMILGIIIKIGYSALVANGEFSYWKITLYHMLLTGVTYEGFYGTIIPYLTKICVVSMLGLLLVNLTIKNKKTYAATTEQI